MQRLLWFIAALIVLAPVAVADVRLIPLATNDLVYEPVSRRIYASVSGQRAPGDGGPGNSIAVIDPVTGAVGPFIPVGSEPGRLALSDDGRTLYVSLAGAGAVRRVDLENLQAGLQFPVGSRPRDGLFRAVDLEVLPGRAESIAVSRQGSSYEGIAIYDNGVPRANSTPGRFGTHLIEFSASSALLYAYDFQYREEGFRRLGVDASGVSVLNQAVVPYLGDDIRFDGGLIYGSSGRVLDPEARRLVGTFGGITSRAVVAPDSKLGQVFFLTGGGREWELRAYDQRTFLLLWSLPLPGVSELPARLIRWGDLDAGGGLAFGSREGHLFLVRPAVSACHPRSADLALSAGLVPERITAGEEATFHVFATNRGPDPATGVVLAATLPAGTTLRSAIAPRGRCEVAGRAVTCDVGALAKGETVRLTLVLTAPTAGAVTLTAGVTGNESDPVLTDNSLTQSTLFLPAPVTSGPTPLGPAELRALPLAANDLVYARVSGRIYASVPGGAGEEGRITAIDPLTGSIGPSIPVGREPNRMDLSEDGRYLYVGLDGEHAIRRIDLRTGVAEPPFPLGGDPVWGPQVAGDIEVLPGRPTSVAVVRRRPGAYPASTVAVYDDGVPRPMTTDVNSGGDVIEFAGSASTLYGYQQSTTGWGFYSMVLDPSGVKLLQEHAGLMYGFDTDMVAEDGLIYASSGQVIDPRSLRVLGVFSGLEAGSRVAPDASTGRVFFLSGTGPARRLLAFDPRSFTLLGSVAVPGMAGGAGSLIRWGAGRSDGGGFAFRAAGGPLYILRTPLITAPNLSLALRPAAVRGGHAAVVTLTLSAPAPPGGLPLSFTSSNPALVGPADVVVPAGAVEITISVPTHAVAQGSTVLLSASSGGVSQSALLALRPSALCSFTLKQERVLGGYTAIGTVTLAEPAPAGGALVALASSDPARADVPATVLVPAGAASTTFPVTTRPVMSPEEVRVTATYDGVSRSALLQVVPLAVAALTFQANIFTSGDSTTGTVTLTGPAPAGGAAVAVASDDPERAPVPATVTVPEGAASTTFPITTRPVTTPVVVRISATGGGATVTAPLVLLPR